MVFQGEFSKTYGFSELEEIQIMELDERTELEDFTELDDGSELDEEKSAELDSRAELTSPPSSSEISHSVLLLSWSSGGATTREHPASRENTKSNAK